MISYVGLNFCAYLESHKTLEQRKELQAMLAARVQRRIAIVAIAIVTATLLLLVAPRAADAATGGCYGAGCNGLNPMGRCNSDAITVRSIPVQDGILDLRYSPSCKANWGRYNPYWRSVTASDTSTYKYLCSSDCMESGSAKLRSRRYVSC